MATSVIECYALGVPRRLMGRHIRCRGAATSHPGPVRVNLDAAEAFDAAQARFDEPLREGDEVLMPV